MININCPFCKLDVYVHIAEAMCPDGGSYVSSGFACKSFGALPESYFGWFMGICPHCSERILIKKNLKTNLIAAIFPNPLPRKLDEDIPEKFRKDLGEADICLSVGSNRATAMMCRRIIHEICKDKNFESLNKMKDAGIITEDYLKLAYAAKLIGDSANHDSEAKIVEKEDAEAALEYVHALIDILYVKPKKVGKQIEKFRRK